ncbi:MAG: PEP-CTERM sorting domain-containing protein [Rhizobacter sp.]
MRTDFALNAIGQSSHLGGGLTQTKQPPQIPGRFNTGSRAVPEPASLALAGIAATRRRNW